LRSAAGLPKARKAAIVRLFLFQGIGFMPIFAGIPVAGGDWRNVSRDWSDIRSYVASFI
jgi:hypothetical protein